MSIPTVALAFQPWTARTTRRLPFLTRFLAGLWRIVRPE